MSRITGLSLHFMMGWNMFLAFLPLPFAVLSQNNFQKSRKIPTVIFFLLWLLFFPNAPYMVTDLIHINSMNFYSSHSYTTDIISWLRLIHIGIGVFLSTLTCMYSLYKIHQMLLQTRNKIIANIILVILCFLSGYAIYIGRFLRFNSWDILKPILLISQLKDTLNIFCLFFSSLFAGYILFVYCILYIFLHQKTYTTGNLVK